MRRRAFITLLAGAAAWPLAARAQQPAMPVIGVLHGLSSDVLMERRFHAFHHGLAESGYVEGKNIVIEYRWAEGQYDRFPALAADLVRRRVAVIAILGSYPAVLAAKAMTETIPIVFYTGGDPIELGIVDSVNRPSSNLTGVTALSWELAPKKLELLHELTPHTETFALLVNPASSNVAESTTKAMKAAARSLRLQMHVLQASSEREIDVAFENMVGLQIGALIVGADAFFVSQRRQLVDLSARHGIPTIYGIREFVAADGLMSYGPAIADGYRTTGTYAGMILKGAKPSDLPIQQPTKFELVINLKTARTLGLGLPPTLIARADELIE